MQHSFVRGVAACAALALSAGANAESLTYNPGLGTLPQAQGWDFDGTYNAPMSVAGGQLTYGATTVNGTTFWSYSPVDSISFATQTVSIEAEIKLTGADFGNFSGYRRGGFSLLLQDDAGRWIIAELGDNRISLGNDNFRTSDPVAVMDLTSDFRTVKLEASPAGARLYVDGVLQLSLDLGSGQSGGARAAWGESTILANATQTQVRSVVYIPAPASGLAMLLLTAGRRRSRRV